MLNSVRIRESIRPCFISWPGSNNRPGLLSPPIFGSTVAKLGQLAMLIVLCGLAFGCEPEGVGDPCEPEQIPPGGFNGSEAYLETSSVQCRTRVCMVLQLDGDPSQVIDDGTCQDPSRAEELGCVSRGDVEDKVYCTCRCKAPSGSTTTTCECPDGFECCEVLELGGPGIMGSYCVKDGTCPGTEEG